MIVKIRDIAAACPRCGGIEFEQVADEPLRLPSELYCTACGAKARYLALINQIGVEAMRRANRASANLKKNRPH